VLSEYSRNTVKLKIFADKNVGDNNICGMKITLMRKEQGYFHNAKIFTANIFIRKFFFIWAMTVNIIFN
jgi:hypothetical protein